MSNDKLLPGADYYKPPEAKTDKPTEAPAPLEGPKTSVADIVGLRFICKSAKRLPNGDLEYCGGTLEGKPEEVLNNKEHKFQIKCPKCRCEFSRGMRFHIMSDQVKGVCELVLALQRAHFGVEFVLKG